MSDLGAQPITHCHDLSLILAVAFSRTGDPATREFGDAKVIRKFGDVPDSFEHAVKLHCVYNEIAECAGTSLRKSARSTCSIVRNANGLGRAAARTHAGESRRPVPGARCARHRLRTAPCTARRSNISTMPAGRKLGIKEVDDGIWLVSFLQYDLGYFDL